MAPTPSLAGSSRSWGGGWGLAVPGHLGFELNLGCPLCAPLPRGSSVSHGGGAVCRQTRGLQGGCVVSMAVTVIQAAVYPCCQHRSWPLRSVSPVDPPGLETQPTQGSPATGALGGGGGCGPSQLLCPELVFPRLLPPIPMLPEHQTPDSQFSKPVVFVIFLKHPLKIFK